jgi:hypothetical protein
VNDVSARRIRDMATRAEELERPLPPDRTVRRNPEESAQSQATAEAINRRVEAYKRGER